MQTLDDMIILQQKETADKVLKALEILDPTCILAGGAPRDWYMAKPAKDLDFFVNLRNDFSLEQTKVSLESVLGTVVTRVGNSETFHYKLNPNILQVFECRIEGCPVQIVICSKPTWNLLDSFAFNVCKVWYKYGRINPTQSFLYALEHKVLIKTGPLYASTVAYEQRIREKFKTFTYYPSKEQYLNVISNRIF